MGIQMNKLLENKKAMALSQVMILVIGMVGFAFIVGIGSMEMVSAEGEDEEETNLLGWGDDGTVEEIEAEEAEMGDLSPETINPYAPYTSPQQSEGELTANLDAWKISPQGTTLPSSQSQRATPVPAPATVVNTEPSLENKIKNSPDGVVFTSKTKFEEYTQALKDQEVDWYYYEGKYHGLDNTQGPLAYREMTQEEMIKRAYITEKQAKIISEAKPSDTGKAFYSDRGSEEIIDIGNMEIPEVQRKQLSDAERAKYDTVVEDMGHKNALTFAKDFKNLRKVELDGKDYVVGPDNKLYGAEDYSQTDMNLDNGRVYGSDGKLVEGGDLVNYPYKWSSGWGDSGFARGAGFLTGHIAQGVVWAGAVYGSLQFLGMFFDDEDQEAFASVSESIALGVLAGKSIYGAIGEGGWLHLTDKEFLWMGAKGWSITAGIGIAAAYLYHNYEQKDTKEVQVQFSCEPWEAPTGGQSCEMCNQQANGELPCSQYQCKSLGQSCDLVNPGTSEAKCVWINRKDAKPPVITPWEEALTEGYDYSPAGAASPPDTGVKILQQGSTTGCVKAFTPLEFGIETDEPAKCKIDYNRVQNFSDMAFWFGGSSTHKYQHEQVMVLPGAANLEEEGLVINNDDDVTLYVRCMDANGNKNEANFVFKFCVEEGPDVTAPEIVTTNVLNGMPVGYNQTSLDMSVYTNEPADCRWSNRDQSYDDMEHEMTCAGGISEYNSQMLYECAGSLEGIQNRQENKFYFKCKDNPSSSEGQRNVNRDSFEFSIMGTRPLIISEVSPTEGEIVKDATETVKVTFEVDTQAGYNDGIANCYYSSSGQTDSYNLFFDTNSYRHSQDLYLAEGNYEYNIKCIDLGGNADEEVITFEVDSDTEAPFVARMMHEESYLKFITNENSSCVYGIVDCNFQFEDGSSATTLNGNENYVDWDTEKSYYIKCQDEYGNRPAPDECSIVMRATRL